MNNLKVPDRSLILSSTRSKTEVAMIWLSSSMFLDNRENTILASYDKQSMSNFKGSNAGWIKEVRFSFSKCKGYFSPSIIRSNWILKSKLEIPKDSKYRLVRVTLRAC